MTSTKYEKMWSVMRSNKIILPETIGDEYKCVICKKILLNSHMAPCGCRFCRECIENYVKDEKTSCPGTKELCKQIHIEMEDVSFDEEVNEKISKLIVGCSAHSCEFKNSLIKMEDHIRNSHGTVSRCQYFNMGCNKILERDRELDHLIKDNHFHTRLIKDFMEHMKKDVELTKIENKYLNCDLKSKHMTIEALRARLDQKYVEIEQLKQDSKNFKNQMTRLIQISNLKEKPITKYKCGEFVWKIDEFSCKRTMSPEVIYSEAFYSHKNGYKFRMYMLPDGVGNSKGIDLCLGFQILPGQFDHVLMWPMNQKVTIGLINQEKGNIHRKLIFKYDSMSIGDKSLFNRPDPESNRVLGSENFMNLNDLATSKYLCKNDQIIIWFFINMFP